jgi:hypothetical protein
MATLLALVFVALAGLGAGGTLNYLSVEYYDLAMAKMCLGLGVVGAVGAVCLVMYDVGESIQRKIAECSQHNKPKNP